MPFRRFVILGLLAAALCSGCGDGEEPKTANDAHTGFQFDTSLVVPDVPPIDEDAQTDTAEVAGDAVAEVAKPTDVSAVQAEAAAAVEIGAIVPLTVSVERTTGDDGAPAEAEEVTFEVSGVALPVGPTVVADPAAQPGVSVWKAKEAGKFWLAGVRPGKAEVVVRVDGVAAAPVPVEVQYPPTALVRVVMPEASGTTPATRQTDAEDTIKLAGKTFGPGGLDITLRFPAAAQAGDALPLNKKPATGNLSVVATVPDDKNQKLILSTGALWLDQTDKGWFRGSFLSRSALLQPVVGVFAIERDGSFGIDVLADVQVVATSTSAKPETGEHMGRAAISAVGQGRALLTWRRINNKTNADLLRVLVDAKSGELDASGAPLVVKAKTFLDGEALPGLGRTSAAESAGQVLVAWEGKAGPDGVGPPKPNRVWMRPLDKDFAPLGDAAVQVAEDECHGQCRVSVHRLPSSRWLILWTAPDGQGIRGRRVKGDLDFAEKEPFQLLQPPATLVRGDTLDANIGAIWHDPVLGPSYRLYTNTISEKPTGNGPETPLGGTPEAWPLHAIAALQAPPSFVAVFLTGPAKAKEARFRRIGLDAALLGASDLPLAPGVDFVVAAGGKQGQAVVVTRSQDKTQAVLRAYKLGFTGPGDPGSLVGAPVEIFTGKPGIEPSLCYVAEADTFVLAWSGDDDSADVRLVRFR